VHARWKIIGLAGVAGVAATGVVIARQRRAHRDYDPDELRERLHRRLTEAATSDGRAAGHPDALRGASSVESPSPLPVDDPKRVPRLTRRRKDGLA
jgi:hypothetical protein